MTDRWPPRRAPKHCWRRRRSGWCPGWWPTASCCRATPRSGKSISLPGPVADTMMLVGEVRLDKLISPPWLACTCKPNAYSLRFAALVSADRSNVLLCRWRRRWPQVDSCHVVTRHIRQRQVGPARDVETGAIDVGQAATVAPARDCQAAAGQGSPLTVGQCAGLPSSVTLTPLNVARAPSRTVPWLVADSDPLPSDCRSGAIPKRGDPKRSVG